MTFVKGRPLTFENPGAACAPLFRISVEHCGAEGTVRLAVEMELSRRFGVRAEVGRLKKINALRRGFERGNLLGSATIMGKTAAQDEHSPALEGGESAQ